MVFLEAVADRYARRTSLERTCFVFPNRRSAVFFRKYLGERAGRPLFVPAMRTIDELFQDISGLKPVEKVPALDRLYRIYRDLLAEEGRTAESFDDFIYWGDILMSDFDDIDKYRVDAARMFVNLRDLKELSAGYDFLTDTQRQAINEFCGSFFQKGIAHSGTRQDFAALWNIQLRLYNRFRDSLAADGLGYPGMIYRSVADDIRPDSQLLKAFDEVVFIGLNALNNCEIALLTELQKEGKADFYWDFEGPLLQDPANKAGRFIRENLDRFPSREPLDGIAPERLPAIEVIRVPSAVGQTRKATQIITELHTAGRMDRPEETAVVLPDESLLFPMLGALPPCIQKVNVTMGYPLSAGQVEMLVSCLERLQANRRAKGGVMRFYHRDVTDLLEHPYIVAADTDGVVPAVKAGILAQNRIFVEAPWLASQSDLFATLFTPIEQTSGLAEWLQALISALQAHQPALEREFLYRYSKTIASLARVALDYDTLAPRTWFRLLARLAALESVPFEGEPLSGLQMMGPLETRALDFKNLILLSVGEGVFPARTVSSSFIPYNLRLGFGLPTYELQDAIWAYYFYRSICRAERVYLLYDARTEGLQSGEESRYIKQLKYHYGLPVTEKVATYQLGATAADRPITTVKKTPEVLQALHDRFITGTGAFSASSLNHYLDCPLQFYYQHVLQIKEQDEVVEDIDSSRFGTIYHEVMQKIYEPFAPRSGAERPSAAICRSAAKGAEPLITKDLIDHLRNDKPHLEQLTFEAFHNVGIDDIEGENRILFNLVLHYVDRTLEVDAGMTPFTFLGAESQRNARLQLADGRTVRLYGAIDRLDTNLPGIIRVVDYKTGSVEKKDDCSNVDRIFDRTLPRRPYIAFQLYFYALLMTRQPDARPDQRYEPCVYALRDLFKAAPASHPIEPKNLAHFAERVQALIEEVFNPAIPFAGDCTDEHICEYCNFKRLCNR